MKSNSAITASRWPRFESRHAAVDERRGRTGAAATVIRVRGDEKGGRRRSGRASLSSGIVDARGLARRGEDPAGTTPRGNRTGPSGSVPTSTPTATRSGSGRRGGHRPDAGEDAPRRRRPPGRRPHCLDHAGPPAQARPQRLRGPGLRSGATRGSNVCGGEMDSLARLVPPTRRSRRRAPAASPEASLGSRARRARKHAAATAVEALAGALPRP